MPGLLDVARSTRFVSVGEVRVDVPGVSAKGLAVLFSRFPVFRELFAGREPDLTPDAIVSLAPDVVAAVIAAGTGSPGLYEAEEAAASLSLADQLALVEAILDATIPGGVGPFVERLTRLAASVGGSDPLGKTPDTKSQPA